ncbi:type 1 glutamine amidotransferase domain-containing protein [Enterococcus songbeiensis]|uniref:type 1 glutamine amidotransferase domain-containing protein n=1 Tax=Enterococcus songbeiensis TaxID=2559927 RepID=UPI0010F7D911|nr:type 1 glutamine amidotransferase domain-containing protein [Enterococcus songbeiensis]
MSKVAVIMTDLVEDIEVTSPKEALENAGHDIVIISEKDTVTGKKGTKFPVDTSIDGISWQDFDALLIPGGFSPDQLRTDERYVQLTKDFLESNRPVFAICHGPQIFIQTELLPNLTLTGYESILPDLMYAGATVRDQPVVIDHNLITSRNPGDLEAFNAAIVNALNEPT